MEDLLHLIIIACSFILCCQLTLCLAKTVAMTIILTTCLAWWGNHERMHHSHPLVHVHSWHCRHERYIVSNVLISQVWALVDPRTYNFIICHSEKPGAIVIILSDDSQFCFNQQHSDDQHLVITNEDT